jgi:hypothetical protein
VLWRVHLLPDEPMLSMPCTRLQLLTLLLLPALLQIRDQKEA